MNISRPPGQSDPQQIYLATEVLAICKTRLVVIANFCSAEGGGKFERGKRPPKSPRQISFFFLFFGVTLEVAQCKGALCLIIFDRLSKAII